MAKITDYIDPRLTIFILWIFFLVVFRCLPTKRLVVKMFRAMGCSCCDGLIIEETDGGGNRRSNEVEYSRLSEEQKHEIDSSRSIAILGHLSSFSLTLKKDEMVHCLSESQSQLFSATLEKNENDNKSQFTEVLSGGLMGADPQCRTTNEHLANGGVAQSTLDPHDPKHQTDEERNLVNDLEQGGQILESGGKEEGKVEEAFLEYTHVSIPLPGRDVNGRSTEEIHESEKQCNPTEPAPKKKKTMFGKRPKSNDEAEAVVPKEKVDFVKNVERRDVPISCAICLTEYEISERICWSSNPECTHVFHEDCVVQWLVTLGKKHCISLDPNETEYLNYQLDCPCCRQNFILKPEHCENNIGEDSV